MSEHSSSVTGLHLLNRDETKLTAACQTEDIRFLTTIERRKKLSIHSCDITKAFGFSYVCAYNVNVVCPFFSLFHSLYMRSYTRNYESISAVVRRYETNTYFDRYVLAVELIFSAELFWHVCGLNHKFDKHKLPKVAKR